MNKMRWVYLVLLIRSVVSRPTFPTVTEVCKLPSNETQAGQPTAVQPQCPCLCVPEILPGQDRCCRMHAGGYQYPVHSVPPPSRDEYRYPMPYGPPPYSDGYRYPMPPGPSPYCDDNRYPAPCGPPPNYVHLGTQPPCCQPFVSYPSCPQVKSSPESTPQYCYHDCQKTEQSEKVYNKLNQLEMELHKCVTKNDMTEGILRRFLRLLEGKFIQSDVPIATPSTTAPTTTLATPTKTKPTTKATPNPAGTNQNRNGRVDDLRNIDAPKAKPTARPGQGVQ